MKKTLYSAALAALIGLGFQVNANAQETILGLADGNNVVQINTAAPNVGTLNPVTNLAAGDTLVGIDFRAFNGLIYGVGSANNVYTLDRTTFAASLVGNFADGVNDDPADVGALVGDTFAFDFNPALSNPTNVAGSFARLIANTDTPGGPGDNDNRVINSNTGEYLGDVKTDVFYPTGDANAGANPNIQGIAYNGNTAPSPGTVQFGIDIDQNTLVTVANNAGTLGTVDGLTLDGAGFDPDGDVGFDISATGAAYASFTTGPNGESQLYTVNLTSGEVTLETGLTGALPGFGVGNNIRSLTVVGAAVPEPSSLAVLAMGVAAIASRRRRK